MTCNDHNRQIPQLQNIGELELIRIIMGSEAKTKRWAYLALLCQKKPDPKKISRAYRKCKAILAVEPALLIDILADINNALMNYRPDFTPASNLIALGQLVSRDIKVYKIPHELESRALLERAALGIMLNTSDKQLASLRKTTQAVSLRVRAQWHQYLALARYARSLAEREQGMPGKEETLIFFIMSVITAYKCRPHEPIYQKSCGSVVGDESLSCSELYSGLLWCSLWRPKQPPTCEPSVFLET